MGINIGALTVKVVVVRNGARNAKVLAHQGRPLEVLKDLLAGAEFAGAEYYGVSGHLGQLSEVAAIQRALREVKSDFDAVASLGGESFLVYILADGKITNVLSHNKCAAGSGEFFVQQIGRMGLGMDEAIRRSFDGKVVPLASRCSVHCKSDITHKLNRKEASAGDILHTLHDSMANKVVALLEKGQHDLRRVLLIGGVTRNTAMLAALREKVPAMEFVVLPESPWFEAWGSALLTRDEPLHKAPKVSVQPSLGLLPPLHLYTDRVQSIAPPRRQAPPDGPMVLGVDAGSTAVKAILLDPATCNMVAANYTRTRGDPVAAARECLRALVDQAGNRHVHLVGTTGSARELAGAYLGTEHVYNEISAHAAGANHFDGEVDTIFEIGGQDAKYIYLRNGVAIDYAMNNACSAGTGSFLKESAQGDLGITVSEIADLALAAPSPVHFKATCAAFINSDIRIAQQEGRSRENIVAGLVYAIADNYLTKVKGPRSVGQKVFLQGGVALNRAVAHALAHSVGRQVVIPPDPELLGALGAAMLALQRSGGASAPARADSADRCSPAAVSHVECVAAEDNRAPWVGAEGVRVPHAATHLLSLAAPEMKLVSRFTCGACRMCCSIDRFEVAGRRFPFGGRCSLFESAWKRKSPTAAAPDLVEQRARLLFGPISKATGPSSKREPCALGARVAGETGAQPSGYRNVGGSGAQGQGREPAGHSTPQRPEGPAPSAGLLARIGIARALTTHSLYPLYSAFLSGLGMEVLLSGVDPRGDLKSYSGFCFPAQIAHGAVLDLARQGDFARGSKLQRLHAGGLPIGGQEALQHGRCGDPRRLPRAGRRRPHRVALREPNHERRGSGPAASPPVPALREQLQLHHRRVHSRHARLRDGFQALSDPRDELYAERSIILKPVDLSDLFLYAAYHGVAGTATGWGMKPGGLALAKACTRIFQADGKQFLQHWLSYQAERRAEDYCRGLFRKTGLLVAGPNDVSSLFEKAAEHVSPAIFGEVIPTVGKGLEAETEGYDGIILIGPFNCLPYRISEAILKPLSLRGGMPILTYESDGYAVAPSFLREVDVHIQQVLDRAARNRDVSRYATDGLAGLIKSAVGKLH